MKTGLGIGLGMLGAIGQDLRQAKQHKRQKELMEIQHKNQQGLNIQGQELQYDLWNKTNAEAQMKHYKDAGLNPALMYGVGGAGGATTGSQGGGSAASGSAAAPMDIQGALQAGLIKAQTDNIKADTENKQADTTKTAGTDTEESKARIGQITEGTGYTKILAEIQRATREDQIDQATYNVEKTIKEIEERGLDNKLKQETINDEINIVKQNVLGAVLENQLRKVNINKTERETKAISEKLLIEAEKLMNEVYRLEQGDKKIKLDRYRLQKDMRELLINSELKTWGLSIDEYKAISGALTNIVSSGGNRFKGFQ